MNQVFCIKLASLRRANDLRQVDMAKILNVERTTYGGYERGTIMPPYDKIETIAKYFGVSVPYLMGDTDNSTPISREPEPSVDVSKTLKDLLTQLKNKNAPVNLDGEELDDESRELLISSVESSLKLGKMISTMKKKG